jgi:hypothetical protein
MITAEKAALFIACNFSQDWLVRNGTPGDRALATSHEWARVLDYVQSAVRIRRPHLVEHPRHLVRVLHEREDAVRAACANDAVFQALWEAVRRHVEAMDQEPTRFERVREWMSRRLF